MKRFLLILAILLIPAISQAANITCTWDAPTQTVTGGNLTDADKAAIVTVIEVGTYSTDHVLAWVEVGKSDAGAATWKGMAPDNFVSLRAKHVLNGMSSPWTTISGTVQPKGIVVIIK